MNMTGNPRNLPLLKWPEVQSLLRIFTECHFEILAQGQSSSLLVTDMIFFCMLSKKIVGNHAQSQSGGYGHCHSLTTASVGMLTNCSGCISDLQGCTLFIEMSAPSQKSAPYIIRAVRMQNIVYYIK